MYRVAHDDFGKCNGVVRESDGAYIPIDTRNKDWRAVCQWDETQQNRLPLVDKTPDAPVLSEPEKVIAAYKQLPPEKRTPEKREAALDALIEML